MPREPKKRQDQDRSPDNVNDMVKNPEEAQK